MEPSTQNSLATSVGRELEQVVSRVAALLAAEAAAEVRAPAASGLDGLARSTEARREAEREHLELAAELVAAALLNEGNPDWDPLDPGSCRAARDGSVLQAMG